jgi:2-keto-4-pentenoate hydratase
MTRTRAGNRSVSIWALIGVLFITGVFGLVMFLPAAYAEDEVELGNILMKAHKANQRIPVASSYNPNLDVNGAYRIQKVYAQQRLSQDQIAGFKGGLCSKAAQTRFGLNAPVAGVLFASGKNTGSPIIEKSAFKTLLIETEIGFMVAKPITQPLKDVCELYRYIETVMPAIELPDAGFAGKARGVDIIAANVLAAQFIAGKETEFRGLDLNNIFVTLTLDGEVVNIGRGTDAMGDQWKAALWLINTIVKQGWKIEPGQILITGALPKAILGKPGKYVADFQRLGKMSFEVK